MAQIFRILVCCPDTGKPIDTGIRTSGRETVSGGLLQAGILSCPHCGKIHSFDRNSYLDVLQNAEGDELWRPNR
jgi:hypothetical protein